MRRTLALITVSAALVALLPSAGLLGLPSPGENGAPGWRVVTFSGRPTQADRDALAASGATSIRSLGGSSYVAWLGLSGQVALARQPGIQSVGLLAPEAKVLPGLLTSGAPAVAVAVHPSAAGLGRSLDGFVASRLVGPDLVELVFRSEAADVSVIAALPEVLHVGTAASGMILEDEASAQIQAGNLSGSTVPPGYRQWLTARGIDGTGVRVSVVDSGVDSIHPDLAGRVVDASDRSVSPTGEPVDSTGHGTHVAGIVAGTGEGVEGTPLAAQKDTSGRLWGLGVAPGAEVVDQNALATTASFALCGTPFWPPPASGWEPITSEALSFDAVGWNASWHTCEGTGVGYTLSTSVLDGLVRDGDLQAAGAQPFSLVFSAGNSGAGTTTDSRLTTPHEGKNMIIVASSDNVRAGSPNQVSSFSSRGLAVDGRVKPDVAAPGGSIVSTRSLPASAVCNQAPTPESQVLYATCSGTSMAAPHVTGALALVTEWRRKTTGSDPSPAFVKAVLINSATDMAARNIPNRDEGWGRVNLGAAFSDAPRVLADQTVVLSDPDQASSWSVTPADPTKPLRATVVWTDPAGAPGANPALVNDLDLEVLAPNGSLFLGNNFDQGRSILGGEPNRVDNVENVFIDSAGSGTYTIRVRAFNLPADGVPFSGDETDQDFALVISNAVFTA